MARGRFPVGPRTGVFAHRSLNAEIVRNALRYEPFSIKTATLVRLYSMTFQELSTNSQDYLKVLWDLREWSDKAIQPTDLARKTGMKPSTVSGAMARLTTQGLVTHAPYGDIILTPLGEQYALKMVRRHRLLETFLVEKLGYRWDEVHKEADQLEHAASDLMIERIDESLGRPTKDPHGDAIPGPNGEMEEDSSILLTDAPEGVKVRIERVSDEDPKLLRFLQQQGLSINGSATIGKFTPYSDIVTLVLPSGAKVALGASAARRIRVTRLNDEGGTALS